MKPYKIIFESALYTDISLEEMNSVLTPLGFSYKNIPGVNEYVYEYPLKSNFKIRIYTSVSKTHEFSRGKGLDAIRINLIDDEDKGVLKLAHTKRSDGWQKRVILKFKEIKSKIKETANGVSFEGIEECPRCGVGKLVLRKSKQGQTKGTSFYGCSKFPVCKFTQSIKKF